MREGMIGDFNLLDDSEDNISFRIFVRIIYIPILLIALLIGRPIIVGKWEPIDRGSKRYIDTRGKYEDGIDMMQCSSCGKWKPKSAMFWCEYVEENNPNRILQQWECKTHSGD